MARPRFFRDPIHHQIRFSRQILDHECPSLGVSGAREGWLLLNLINSAAFQRLRHIRQNGLTNLVFHGMEHSRFSHSMGVSYLAGEMYDRIVRNTRGLEVVERDRLAVLAAGLLHDVGHGPFSHAIEEALNSIHGQRKWFHHEAMTERILLEDGEISKRLEDIDAEFPRFVAGFIRKDLRQTDHWAYRLVSSQLDADRIDYLLRDAHHAGLVGHGFDVPRLLDMLYTKRDRVIVDRHATEAVEAYLLMLRHAYRAIYFHARVRAATVLLISLLKRAFHLHKDRDVNVFPSGIDGMPHPLVHLVEQGQECELDQYTRLTDYHVWQLAEEWQWHSDAILSDLSRRLIKRQPYKTMDLSGDEWDYETTHEQIQRISDLARPSLGFDISLEDVTRYYVVTDSAQRVDYKRPKVTLPDEKPSAEKGLQEESIWLGDMGGDGEETTLESEIGRNKIIGVLADEQKQKFTRIMFPHEIVGKVFNSSING